MWVVKEKKHRNTRVGSNGETGYSGGNILEKTKG